MDRPRESDLLPRASVIKDGGRFEEFCRLKICGVAITPAHVQQRGKARGSNNMRGPNTNSPMNPDTKRCCVPKRCDEEAAAEAEDRPKGVCRSSIPETVV